MPGDGKTVISLSLFRFSHSILDRPALPGKLGGGGEFLKHL